MLPRRAIAVVLLACSALAGCSTQLHGNQSVSGGSAATTTSSAVVASTASANARVAFSSGTPVPVSAPGGQVSVARGGSGALILGIVLVDAIGQLVSWIGAPPAPPAGARPASIADTCSCYKKEGEM